MNIPGDIVMFKALPEPDQIAILNQAADNKDRQTLMRYFFSASKATKQSFIASGKFNP
jgi:hypothetical protein